MRISDWSSDLSSADLGPQVDELANEILLANAAGGILATQGKISADGRPAATMQRIELLDGPTLWPDLRGLIDPQQRAVILADAATKARQRTLLSWLLALVAGIAVFLLAPESPESAAAAAPAATRLIQPAGDAGKPVPDPWLAAPAPDAPTTPTQPPHTA